MLTIETQSGDIMVETKWCELSPVQFVKAVNLTNRFLAGAFGLSEYRLHLLEMLTGYKRKSRKHKHAEQINENLFLLSEQLNFAVLPDVGPPEILEFFSPELRELLKTRFPWEIFAPEHVQQILTVENLLKVNFRVNFNLELNPLPFIRTGNTILEGPVFSTDNGDIDTNLKAGNYLDASEYFNAYGDTKNEKYLDSFINCLYRPTTRNLKPATLPNSTDPDTRAAIIMLFIYIQQTFANDPIFGILFKKGDNSTGFDKISLGADEVVGAMVESGYGTPETIAQMDIRTFFNFQIMFLRRNIEQLRGMKKNASEIAKTMNLPIETVQKL